MKKFHMISGLPRSGSTLLCQILNMNPDFNATPTSPMLDMLQAIQYCFSHNAGFKATNRMDQYENYCNAQRKFIETFYEKEGNDVVFDKNRGWVANLMQLDAVMGDTDSKVLWTYRDPEHVICSMEARHRETPLLQYPEEGQSRGAFSTLNARIGHWTADGGIVSFPVWALHDAVENGYSDRIFIVNYDDLCKTPQKTMNDIHDFLGLPKFKYDKESFKDLKQTTVEHDTFYNHKYPHNIKEGAIKFKEPSIVLPKNHKENIDKRYSWLKTFVEQKRKDWEDGKAKRELAQLKGSSNGSKKKGEVTTIGG